MAWRSAGQLPGTVKRFGGDVGGQEGDGIQAQPPGCFNRSAQAGAVRFLHGRAPSNHHLGPEFAERLDAAAEPFECPRHSSNLIVNFWWTVERHGHVVDGACH